MYAHWFAPGVRHGYQRRQTVLITRSQGMCQKDKPVYRALHGQTRAL